jgi:signal transduction histidine kinase
LINAIEAMPSGGSLSISVIGNPDARQVTVEICDTGDGIPQELMPRLFEPFATGKERGTGLGLAVSRRILEEHGGTIAVRARHPRGTIFEVTLPAVIADVPEAVASV